MLGGWVVGSHHHDCGDDPETSDKKSLLCLGGRVSGLSFSSYIDMSIGLT